MTNTTAWLIVALMTLLMASCAAAQDGAPTEADIAAAVAADLQDAQAQAALTAQKKGQP